MANNFFHPAHQHPSQRAGTPSLYSQPPICLPPNPPPNTNHPPPHAQFARPTHVNPNHLLHRQSSHPLPPSNLHQKQTVKMTSGPYQIPDSPPKSAEPPMKKVKLDPLATPMPPPRPSSKPPTPVKPPGPAYPIIDIIPAGPRGDTVIQLSLPTVVATQGAAKSAAAPKRIVLLRLHALLLTLHSPFFRDLLSLEKNAAVTAQQTFTDTSPWVLPADWDGAAFLDWCVMVCGRSSVYDDVVVEQEKEMDASQQQQEGKKVKMGGEAAETGGAKKSTKAGDGGRMGRFPRVVALADKLGCAQAMKFHCAMPLWRFFGPRGEADDDGLGHRGLTILDAIAIAYVVDDETLFRRATEFALVNFDKDQWNQEISGGLELIVPRKLIDDIKAKRRLTLSNLEKATYVSVSTIYNKVTSLEPCNGAMEKLAIYAIQLCHVRNGAFDFADTRASLANVWDVLEEAAEAVPETTKKCSKSCEGGCTVDVREILLKAAEESKHSVEGLCLRCVKERMDGNSDVGAVCEHEVED